MVVQADYYQNMPGNNHTLAKEARSERGTIATYDGVVLARSVKEEDGTYEREYPAGDLASHVVGYSSPQFGNSGIEKAYNDTLKGEENFASWTDVLNSFAGIGTAGNDVTLTLNSKIQQAAQDALAGRKGACVVMDPDTGAILAMASAPTYNAADFAAVIEQANANPDDSTLVDRAAGSLYAPGSTFKIVTLATALEDDVADEDTVFSSPGTMEIGNATVSNFNKANYGSLTLAQATELSSNTVFGQLGVEMGADKLVAGAESFGFNKEIDFPLYTPESLMPSAEDLQKSPWELAWQPPASRWETPRAPAARARPAPRPPCSRWPWWAQPSPTTASSCSPTSSTA